MGPASSGAEIATLLLLPFLMLMKMAAVNTKK
jgi:hypothetical protein